ncbi:MAG: hypothetical protein U0401_04110 [Anaerolineae bacterium]
MNAFNVSNSNNLASTLSPLEEHKNSQDKVERLSREIKEVSTLYNIGVAVGSSLNLNEVLTTLYKESSRLIDTSNFAVLYDEPAETFKLYDGF